eukprot:365071-Chlamydomonas_euryale.AAC.2
MCGGASRKNHEARRQRRDRGMAARVTRHRNQRERAGGGQECVPDEEACGLGAFERAWPPLTVRPESPPSCCLAVRVRRLCRHRQSPAC